MLIATKENTKTYRSFALHNYRQIPQITKLTDEQLTDVDVVSQVLPFKANNYVVNELINWDKAPDDPIFTLTFPRKEMLRPEHYDKMYEAVKNG